MYAITSKSAPKTGGPFPQGATAARFVFVSGQLPLDPKTNEPVPGGIGQQTARCIMNVEAVLAELNLSLGDVTQATVYLVDLADLEFVDEIWSERFMRPGPARTCVQVSAVERGARIQVSAIACR